MHYCVSDIHGDIDAFHKILKKINFSDNDELYILGDILDRGKDGINIFLEILDMPNVHLIKGNHEALLEEYNWLRATEDRYLPVFLKYSWDPNGGEVTREAFEELRYKDIAKAKKILERIHDAKYEIKLNINNQNYILRHNLGVEEYNLARDLKLVDNGILPEDFIIWDRKMLFTVDYPNDIVIFGHTPVSLLYESLEKSPFRLPNDLFFKLRKYSTDDKLTIFSYNNQYCIDCGAVFSYYNDKRFRLACLRLEDMKEFYSNE